MKVLGIETSCDETSVAVVTENREILSNIVKTQLKEHEAYAGVVPEIAARAHLDYLDLMIPEALKQAGCNFEDLDGVAVTSGPGLIGGVIVGVMAAKSIALAHNLPLIGINHLEGHLLTSRLTDNIDFPYVTVLVSGGHSQILLAHELGSYQRLSTTIDDAVGEAFDKSAKVMGLGYPGGPKVEEMAKKATNPARFKLPRPTLKDHALNVSFSGLKTALRRHAEKHTIEGKIAVDVVCDLSAALQEAIGDVLCDRLTKILKEHSVPSVVLCGGVSANFYLRERLTKICDSFNATLYAPPLSLAGDNAAMIAWAGVERLQKGLLSDLSLQARPRWPLDEEAISALGSATSKSGVKV